MSKTILVTGATGRLGKLVVHRLLKRGETVRVLTRDANEAKRLWRGRVEIVTGDFALPGSLTAAVHAVDRVFLLSPIGDNLVRHQSAVIDAAQKAGVSRIVKISGSDWTISNRDRSIAGTAHAQVEDVLASSGIAHTVLRPNAWMQVSFAPVIAALAGGHGLTLRYGDAQVSFIDAEDIANVAVHALTSERALQGPLVLTGGQAIGGADLAHIASGILQRPVGLIRPPHPSQSRQPLTFEEQAIAEFIALIGEGVAAPVTSTVTDILGRAPHTAKLYFERALKAALVQIDALKGETTWH